MPRVVTRLGCISNDSILVKFLIEEKTGRRVFSMPMRDQASFNRAFLEKKSERPPLSHLLFPGGGRFTSASF